jgi:hypothetical protein
MAYARIPREMLIGIAAILALIRIRSTQFQPAAQAHTQWSLKKWRSLVELYLLFLFHIHTLFNW